MHDTEAPAAPMMAPLKERWPQIWRYAVHPAALSTILAIAISHTVVLMLMVIGPILDLVVWAAFFKYGFEVLRWSANGRDTPPEISFTVGDHIANYTVLLFILVEVSLIAAGIWFGVLGVLILGCLIMLALPAMVMILALEEGMVRALNPIAWLMLMSRLGNEYFVLVGIFCAAIVAQSLLSAAISHVLPGLIAEFITYCIVNYFMLTNFHVIGSVIYDHREDLGYTGHVELGEQVPYTDKSRSALDAARERAATGDTAGAAALLRDELASHSDLLPLHDEYRHWLRQGDDKTELVAHAKTYIPILLEKDQDRRAVEVTRECQSLDPNFALDNAEMVTRLAHVAADAGQTQLALGLIAGYHKRFRNHPDIPKNYLLAAKLWAERMNKEMQARAMLNQIKLTFPNDPVIPKVDAYIAFLDKLAATSPSQKPPT